MANFRLNCIIEDDEIKSFDFNKIENMNESDCNLIKIANEFLENTKQEYKMLTKQCNDARIAHYRGPESESENNLKKWNYLYDKKTKLRLSRSAAKSFIKNYSDYLKM